MGFRIPIQGLCSLSRMHSLQLPELLWYVFHFSTKLMAHPAQATHLVYNRVEPRKLRIHFSLLVGVPVFLIGYFHSLFSSWIKAFLYLYPSFIVTLLFSLGLYRLSPLHPLAKFPGPVLNRISNLKMCQVAAGRKRHIYLKELHDQYGPYVRIGKVSTVIPKSTLSTFTGPNVLSIVDVDAVHPIFGSKGLPRNECKHSFILLPDFDDFERSLQGYWPAGSTTSPLVCICRLVHGLLVPEGSYIYLHHDRQPSLIICFSSAYHPVCSWLESGQPWSFAKIWHDNVAFV